MRIVFWARLGLARQEILHNIQSVPGVEAQMIDNLPGVLAALPGADGLVLAHGPQEEARQVLGVLKRPGNRVRWMHFMSAGREGYEELGWPPGVAVTYAGGGVSPAVAEHAMALLLALCRRIPDIVSVTQRQTWDRSLTTRATSLEGATMVVVGFGHIARELAARARPFGVRVVAVSRGARPDPLADESLPLTELRAALARADVVAVTIALTPETTHLLGDAEFAACKPGALLVNVARGPVIDQAAMARALHGGQLGGAAVDVTDPEPLPDGHPFWSCPNLLVSPHVAGAGSPRSIARLGEGVGDNLRRLVAGQPLLHQVSAG